MTKDIPVFIHHECRTPYALKSVKMAEKYNKVVVFLGDDSNKDYSKNWVDVNEYCRDEWKKFLRVYRNMSFYDDGYAVKIFKRLFAMKEYMKDHGMTECVLIDSDVLSFINYSDVPAFRNCDMTLFIPGEEPQGLDPMKLGNFDWGASAGTSYFKYEALCDFISFMLDMYENHIDILELKWEWHQKHNIGGGVCEMTLLFLWYLQTDYKVVNTKTIFSNNGSPYVIDNDVRTINNRCLFQKYKKKNIEKVLLRDGLPYLIDPKGNLVRAVCLHFGGNTKIYMGAYFAKSQIMLEILLNFAYVRLSIFNILAKIYVQYFKKYIGKYRKPKYGKNT